jgi:hypothetical protein
MDKPSYYFKEPSAKPLTFYGFNWLPFSKHIDDNFCREVDRNIMFNRNGCALWIGKTKKKWIEVGQYIPVPWAPNSGGSQELYRKILLYTLGKTQLREGYKFIPECGNPLCVNPDHVTYIHHSKAWIKYVDFVEEGSHPQKWHYNYAVVSIDNTWGKCFYGLDQLAEVMGMSPIQASRYCRTERYYGGKFKIVHDKTIRENPFVEDLETDTEE